MSNNDRPLSPHISIYRWPITMTLSILHRGTGLALSVGLLVLVAWLFSAALSVESYTFVVSSLDSTPGRVCLIGWSFAFFFHLSNGIRHLVWDAGFGFEMRQATASGWFVLLLALVLTTVFWVLRP